MVTIAALFPLVMEVELVARGGLPRQTDRGIVAPVIVDDRPVGIERDRQVGIRVRVEVLAGDKRAGRPIPVGGEVPQLIGLDRPADADAGVADLVEPVDARGRHPARRQVRVEIAGLEIVIRK